MQTRSQQQQATRALGAIDVTATGCTLADVRQRQKKLGEGRKRGKQLIARLACVIRHIPRRRYRTKHSGRCTLREAKLLHREGFSAARACLPRGPFYREGLFAARARRIACVASAARAWINHITETMVAGERDRRWREFMSNGRGSSTSTVDSQMSSSWNDPTRHCIQPNTTDTQLRR